MTRPDIRRLPVASSSLAALGYCADLNILAVEFRNGSVYHYFGVPLTAYDGLRNAVSKGRHLNDHIKPCYPYAKVPEKC